MEERKELRLELLRIMNKQKITLNNACIPDHKSKRFTSDEIRVCLDFLVKEKLITNSGTRWEVYGDLTLQGDSYLKELENEKKGWLLRNIRGIVVLIIANFILAILAGLFVLAVEYLGFLKYTIQFK